MTSSNAKRLLWAVSIPAVALALGGTLQGDAPDVSVSLCDGESVMTAG
jgi:hypothetical protein